MSRVWSAVKLLAALAAVAGLLFAGAALLLSPGGHGDGNALTDNPASRAIRGVFDRDDAVIDAVQAAHDEFNAQIWGDGGNLAAACTRLEEAATAVGDSEVYDGRQVRRLGDVKQRVCDTDGSDMQLHDALADLEETLRDRDR